MSERQRAAVHGMWGSVSDNWIARADFLEARGASVTKAILDRAAITSTDRVLALADGPGGMALAAAPSAASVVSTDVVASYAETVAARARERGLTNVTTEAADIEAIPQPDASFDVVVCREGLMFAVEPSRAFGEIGRVLRPGGRLAAAVWGPPEANPWLALVLGAVGEVVGHPVPPPGVPGPFSLSDRSSLSSLPTAAGMDLVAIDDVEVPFHAPSFEAWWSHTKALAGPIANIVAMLDEAVVAQLEQSLRERVSPYATTDGIEIPGLSLVISATKLR